MSRTHEIIEKVVESFNKVVIDNEFERAYEVPYDAFKDYTKEEIIEALYIHQAIHLENTQ